MGKIIKVILIFLGFGLLLSACNSLHTIYRSKDVKVINAATGQECVRKYSNWDGKVWSDYYGPPCSVYLEDKAEPLQQKIEMR